MLNGDYVNKGESFTYTGYIYNAEGSAATKTQTSTVQGLNSIAKSQIAPAKWYLGGNSTNYLIGSGYYNFERETTVVSGNSTNILANVGLMYPSDYVYTYANGVDSKCFGNGAYCGSGTPSAGWLFNSKYQWTISPFSTRWGYVFYLQEGGSVSYDDTQRLVFHVRPCVYLRSDIEITGGDGSSVENAYTLKAPTN